MFVDGGIGWVLRLDTGFVCLDVGTKSSSVGNVVYNPDTSISVSKAVRSDFVSMGITGFSSEGSARQVAFIVAEGVVANVLKIFNFIVFLKAKKIIYNGYNMDE